MKDLRLESGDGLRKIKAWEVRGEVWGKHFPVLRPIELSENEV